MFFENFHEEIGSFDDTLIEDFKKKIFSVDLSDPALERPEFCFKDGGKLILPMHFAEVRDPEYFAFVKPLIDKARETGHRCLKNTVPFRIEISIVEPGKDVLWHVDQHLFHKFSERIHFPIITSDHIDFYGKWFKDDILYKYKMNAGKIYRFNNRVLHTVKNNNFDNFRCHAIIDFIDRDILYFFMQRGTIENLKNNVVISPADEIFYYVNNNVTGAEQVQFTEEDIRQLRLLKETLYNDK